MQIYFSYNSAPDQDMMNEIRNIHSTAINNFVLSLVSEEKLNEMKDYKLEIHLNSRMKTRGGTAQYNRLTRKIRIEINYRLHKVNMNELKSTYLHELGHAVDFFLFNSSSHDYRWKTITAALGGSTERTHKMDTSEFKVRKTRYNYSCGCRIHTVSSIKHNRIQRGLGYRCTECKETLKVLTNEMKKFVPEKTGVIG